LIIDPDIGGEEAVRASQEAQIVNAVCDASGFCQFIQPTLDEIRSCYGLFYGEEVSREEIVDFGWQCLEEEWEFNRRAGFTADHDDMAACLREEGIGPDNSLTFNIDKEVTALAKVRFPNSDSLFGKSASGG
jgi:aldehyde:ferredoxin oxidoreductase